MKLWIDDVRPAPEGWEHAKDYPSAIAALATGTVLEVSFDHDLGDPADRTGYTAICWLERTLHAKEAGTWKWNMPVPIMHVHSDNGPGRERIANAIRSIKRKFSEKV